MEHDFSKEIEKLKQENEALRNLYESLLDFGQDNKLPKEKLDFVKARVFDATVLLNRIAKSFNIKKDVLLSN
jgi:hypothetical protein